jgi:hypothetical protein
VCDDYDDTKYVSPVRQRLLRRPNAAGVGGADVSGRVFVARDVAVDDCVFGGGCRCAVTMTIALASWRGGGGVGEKGPAVCQLLR